MTCLTKSCRELIRTLLDRGVELRMEGGKLRAAQPELIRDLMPALKRWRPYVAALTTGRWGERETLFRVCRTCCREVMDSGRCRNCLCCGDWVPLMEDGELTGLCVSRETHIDNRPEEGGGLFERKSAADSPARDRGPAR